MLKKRYIGENGNLIKITFKSLKFASVCKNYFTTYYYSPKYMKQTLIAEKLELKLKNHSEKAARDKKNRS